MVFIKDERDKTKVRDRYIVVSIEKGYASIQKLTERFMARKYTVPLSRLYPASVSTPILPAATLPLDEEEDSDEDYSNNYEGDEEGNEEDELELMRTMLRKHHVHGRYVSGDNQRGCVVVSMTDCG